MKDAILVVLRCVIPEGLLAGGVRPPADRGRRAVLTVAALGVRLAIMDRAVTRMLGGGVLFPAVEVLSTMDVELPELAIPSVALSMVAGVVGVRAV